MKSAVSLAGYPPYIYYCPGCAEENIDVSNEKVSCDDCGLICHIIEGDDSKQGWDDK